MTRQQLIGENTFLRELVTQYQFVRWARLTTCGEPLREACQRLEVLEGWATMRGIGFAAKHAPHDAELPNPEIALSCACGDRLSVSGGAAAVAAAIGYFTVLHSGKKCRVEQVAA